MPIWICITICFCNIGLITLLSLVVCIFVHVNVYLYVCVYICIGIYVWVCMYMYTLNLRYVHYRKDMH